MHRRSVSWSDAHAFVWAHTGVAVLLGTPAFPPGFSTIRTLSHLVSRPYGRSSIGLTPPQRGLKHLLEGALNHFLEEDLKRLLEERENQKRFPR
jgi:hypothetical protein